MRKKVCEPEKKVVKQQNQIVCGTVCCVVPVYQQDEGETLRATIQPAASVVAEATTTNLRKPNQRRTRRNEFVSASVYALLFSLARINVQA